jgi:Fe-Mn family superoxide dismutase
MWKATLCLSLCSILVGSNGIHSAEAVVKNAEKVSAPVLGKYEVKNFEYLLDKTPGLSKDLLVMHFKLYQGYVNNTNSILQKLQEMDAKSMNRTPEFAGLKRMLGWEFNGMLLHEYYFENLGGNEPLNKSDPLYAKIEADFGSFDNWKDDFVATGLIRGIGWVVTYVDPKEGRLINQWINEHDLGHLSGAKPLIIMDVFEHAYITEYGLDRAKYIDIFLKLLNWKKVSERYNRK